MSQKMLSSRATAIPKTNAERASQPPAQMALSGLAPGEEQPDEPGEEMARHARVWKTYVRETDKWDKEMVDGRNSSLDVLLIFAALFSAISTTFIVASLGDLKPDYAQSSAQTLQTMLQTQQAMLQALSPANGQPVSLPLLSRTDSPSFSPSSSAVAVNMLWLLSLALSVGVSLVAMLAKDWCYRFMQGRSGHAYDQGRRRQLKWDGIERWRMQGVLAHLPGVMHLAVGEYAGLVMIARLFFPRVVLFAVGLCIYLWDIHVVVATPVTVVTITVTCGYMAATVLPTVQRYCPYSTPVTVLLAWCIAHPVLRLVEYLQDRENAAPVWERIYEWINSHCVAPDRHDTDGDRTVPMDDATARMIAWLITTCDDFRSVDIALQAIAGAEPSLPCLPLLSCDAHRLTRQRFHRYTGAGWKLAARYYNSQTDQLIVLCYVRSMAVLVTCGLQSDVGLSEEQVEATHEALAYGLWVAANTYNGIFDRCCEVLGGQAETVLLTAASCTTLAAQTERLYRLSHWYQHYMSDFAWHEYSTNRLIASVLQQPSMSGVTLDAGTVCCLLDSIAHWVACCKPEARSKQGELYASLVRLYLMSDRQDAEITRRATHVLAVCAFALHTYPGGEEPGQANESDGSQRALQVLRYYQDNCYDQPQAFFAFGVVAALPYLQPEVLNTSVELKDKLLPALLEGVNWFVRDVVHALPYDCPIDGYTVPSAAPVAAHSQAMQGLPEPRTWSAALLDMHGLNWSDPRLYVHALAALCSTGSDQLQRLCMRTLDSQVTVDNAATQVPDYDFVTWANLVCTTKLQQSEAMYAAALYFRLLIAMLMLSSSPSLEQRADALSRLQRIYCSENRVKLNAQDDHRLNVHTILDHVSELTYDLPYPKAMRQTMQLVTDFCHMHRSSNKPFSGVEFGCANWMSQLEQIRRARRPAVSQLASVAHPRSDHMVEQGPSHAAGQGGENDTTQAAAEAGAEERDVGREGV